MRYGSVCSGIEAATIAWHPLGWEPTFFSEIEAFPRAVLQHHYPETQLHGDFTTIGDDDYGSINLLVGGTPCQSFSVAGLRKGMDDERGNLALEYLKLAQRKRPTWLVWENVPGVLSSNGGRDFGAFLGGLGELGYGFAYRVLDAQYFGVAQRRRRVFVVGYLGDWRPPAAVLFERHSLQGHPAPRREAGESFAHDFAPSVADTVQCTTQDWSRSDGVKNFIVSGSQNEERQVRDKPIVIDRTAFNMGDNCQGAITIQAADTMNTLISRGPHAIAFGWQNSASQGDSVSDSVAPTLDKSKTPAVMTQYGTELAGSLTTRHDSSPCADRGQNMVAFTQNQRDELRTVEVPGALSAQPGMKQQTYVAQVAGTLTVGHNDCAGHQHRQGDNSFLVADHQMQVRRLTPIECERLQGFPDNYTRIPYRGKEPEICPDGPRYKALGNSMAVPVMHWIGKRIDMVNELLHEHYGDERKERQAEVMK